MLIMPNQQKTVYCEIASKWGTKGESFETLLIFSGYGIHQERKLDLPSWVPDWDALTTTLRTFKPYSYGLNTDHTAKEGSTLLPIFSISNNILRVVGAAVTTVKYTRPLSSNFSTVSQQVSDFCAEYMSTRISPTYRTGIPHLQALFRLLLCDLDVYLNESRLSSSSSTFVSLAIGFLMKLTKQEGIPSREVFKAYLERCLPLVKLSPGSGFASSFCENFLGHSSPYIDPFKPAEDVLMLNPSNLIDLSTVSRSYESNFNRSIFETSNGLLGVGPHGMQAEDLVCVLLNCRMPAILRKVGSHYLFVGSCFVLGLMDGEALMPGPLGYFHNCDVRIFDIC